MTYAAIAAYLMDNRWVKLKNIIDFLLLGALWGLSYVFIRLTVGHVAPIVMAESRLLIGAIGIFVFSLFKKSWRENIIPAKADLGRITIIASFNVPYLDSYHWGNLVKRPFNHQQNDRLSFRMYGNRFFNVG